MIGQLGETAISALGNSQQLLTFSFLLFAALSTGGSILISQYVGANNKQQALAVSGSIITGAALPNQVGSSLRSSHHRVSLSASRRRHGPFYDAAKVVFWPASRLEEYIYCRDGAENS